MKREEVPAHVGDLVNAIFLYKGGKATLEVTGFIYELDHKHISIGQQHPNDHSPLMRANRFNKYPITCLEICEVHDN